MVKLVQPVSFDEVDSVRPDFNSIGHAALKPTRDRSPESPIRVLVIDDDTDILGSLSDAFGASIYNVKTTNSFQGFRDQFTDFDPDFIITDLAMPTHDGMDVLHALRDQAYTGEVIVMSGKEGHVLDSVRRVASSYGLNVAGVLRKPFTPQQLMAIVTKNGGERSTEDSRVLRALSDRKIRPYFQPKIDLKTGRIVGAEALSRWHHPNRGLLNPQSYLKSKRQTAKNTIHDFTILERATEFCAKLQSMGQDMKIAVNFAADVVLSDDFPEVVADVTRRHRIPPDRMIIELTEDETTEKYEELAERLLKLRLLGVELAIDDFGTGHSSLSRLQHLPVSELKIDRSFVTGLDEYSDNLAIVRSIVDLAHSLHCSVVAEGVETIEAVEALRHIGCDMAQGFVFSPAVNDSTFIALVRDSPFVFAPEVSAAGR